MGPGLSEAAEALTAGCTAGLSGDTAGDPEHPSRWGQVSASPTRRTGGISDADLARIERSTLASLAEEIRGALAACFEEATRVSGVAVGEGVLDALDGGSWAE